MPGETAVFSWCSTLVPYSECFAKIATKELTLVRFTLEHLLLKLVCHFLDACPKVCQANRLKRNE